MLPESDWQFLKENVTNHWFLADHPMSVVRMNFNDDSFIAEVELSDGRPGHRAAMLIKAVQHSRLLAENSPLAKLINGLKGTPAITVDGHVVEHLDSLLDKIAIYIAASAADDPRLTFLLAGNRVFMNRTSLREDLRLLMTGDEKLVMRVSGDKQSGTSYTKELVMHLTGTEQFRVASANLLEFSSPKDVISFLALAIKDDATPPEIEGDDPDKWIRVATRWLVSLAQNSGSNWWFVLDQCNHVQDQTQYMDLINRLAEQIRQNTKPGVTIRLLLLGHSSDLTDEMRGRIVDNETRTLTKSDVMQVLRKVANNTKPSAADGQSEISDIELDKRIASIATEVWEVGERSGQLVASDLNIALEEAISEYFF